MPKIKSHEALIYLNSPIKPTEYLTDSQIK